VFNQILKQVKRPSVGALFLKKENELRMDSVAHCLNKTINSLGTVFGSISQSLEDLDAKTTRLREDCKVLLQSAGGQEENTNLLFRVADTLQGHTHFLDECSSKQEERCDMMRECETTVDHLLKKQTEMVSALEPLKFMLVFFKIEASQLCEADRQTFHSVSEETAHLHALVDETFQRNIKSLAQARRKIQEAKTSSKTAQDQQSTLTATKQKEISQAISALKAQIRNNSEKTADLDHEAEGFEAATSVLVMSLQYEDIIRQRCEHILEKLHQKPKGIRNATWLLYQAKQIETAAEEMRQSSEEIRSGLQNIDDQAKRLHQTSTTMDQFEHITASADGMVQTLLESLESIHEMLTQSTTLSQSSCEAIAPVQSLTQELSAIVFEVSVKIQFIALNAQVRSIQVGAGSGLEVLAARTAEISTQLRELGDETSKSIHTLHTTVESLVNASKSEYEDGKKQLGIIEDHGSELEGELHRMRDNTFDSLELVGSLATQVEEFTQADIQRLQILSELAVELDQKAQNLRAEVRFDSLSKREKKRIEAELHSLLDDKKDAMHNRLHDKSTATEANFDLQISNRAQQRSNGELSVSSENVEFF